MMIFKKNLVNQSPGPVSVGTGLAEFSGTLPQSIFGQNIIQDLRVNNIAGFSIGGETRVNGIFYLDNGQVTLDNNHLILWPESSVAAGIITALTQFIPTASGELRKEFPAGSTPGSFNFNVGDNSGIAEISPVHVSVSSGIALNGNYIGVRLVNAQYPDPGITGNYLNRYWVVNQSGFTGATFEIRFAYQETDVIGDESILACTRVNPVPWINYGLANPVGNLLVATGISTLGTFTGVKSSTPPANQQIQNIHLYAGDHSCYDAQQVLTIAGNGTIFHVYNGANATLVAGQKILMQPGTYVAPGGYLHGYITPNGNYCGSVANMLTSSPSPEQSTGVEETMAGSRFKVYPNPTAASVIVELEPHGIAEGAIISVYNLQGEKLFEKTYQNGLKFELTLEGKPTGCYLFHVISNGESGIAKVIKL